MNRITSRIITFVLLTACIAIAGCVSIQKSPPLTIKRDVSSAAEAITSWVSKTYKTDASLFQDGVVYRPIPGQAGSIRIELEWNAPDIYVRKPFAVIVLTPMGPNEVVVTVEEEKDDMPFNHKFQDIAAKLPSVFAQAGVESK